MIFSATGEDHETHETHESAKANLVGGCPRIGANARESVAEPYSRQFVAIRGCFFRLPLAGFVSFVCFVGRKKKINDYPFPYRTEIELEISTLTNLGVGLGRVALSSDQLSAVGSQPCP